MRVGMEATGYSRWFERLPAALIRWAQIRRAGRINLEAAAGFVLPRTKPVRVDPKKWPTFLNSRIVTAQQSVSRYRSDRFWSPLSNSWHRVRARRHPNAAWENNLTRGFPFEGLMPWLRPLLIRADEHLGSLLLLLLSVHELVRFMQKLLKVGIFSHVCHDYSYA